MEVNISRQAAKKKNYVIYMAHRTTDLVILRSGGRLHIFFGQIKNEIKQVTWRKKLYQSLSAA